MKRLSLSRCLLCLAAVLALSLGALPAAATAEKSSVWTAPGGSWRASLIEFWIDLVDHLYGADGSSSPAPRGGPPGGNEGGNQADPNGYGEPPSEAVLH